MDNNNNTLIDLSSEVALYPLVFVGNNGVANLAIQNDTGEESI